MHRKHSGAIWTNKPDLLSSDEEHQQEPKRPLQGYGGVCFGFGVQLGLLKTQALIIIYIMQ